MNFDKLYEILGETTAEFRKGEAIEKRAVGPVDVVEIYDMPPESEAVGLEMVDVFFMTIGVDKVKAESRRADLIEILNDWPNGEMADGPSYIAVGGTIGSQGAAFNLFALGKVLGLWEIITPDKLFLMGQQARDAAGSGFIMITGYRKGA